MTKKAKPKLSEDGKTYLRNNKKQKSGLNKAILNVALGQLKTFTFYKLNKAGKAYFPTPPPYISQRCFDCKNLKTKRLPILVVFFLRYNKNKINGNGSCDGFKLFDNRAF